MKKLILTLLTLLLLSLPLFAAEPKWSIMGVRDGDTIVVYRIEDGEKIIEVIRLQHIDCPEHNQEFGSEAKAFTESFVKRAKFLYVAESAHDRYGRMIGVVSDDEGRVLNQLLVRNGFAWWYKQYSKDSTYNDAEKAARAEHLGLWSKPSPVPPWEFRKAGKKK